MTKPMNETIQKLRDVFPESQLSWRIGRTRGDKAEGQALPYIDNRMVQNRLDEALGPENWESSYQEVVAGNRLVAVRCKLSLKIGGEWVSKEDAAPLDTSSELAIKGVYSDAMKRAAVQWGIGRYLYDFVAPWIALENGDRLSRIPTLAEGMKSEAGKAAPAVGEPSTPAAPVQEAAPVEPEQAPTAQPEAGAPEAAADPVKDVLQLQGQDKPAAPVETKPEVKAEVKADAKQVQAQAAAKAEPAGGGGTEQSALFKELLAKLEKLPPKMIRTYIEGPKGQEKLSAAEREDLLKKVAEREAAQNGA